MGIDTACHASGHGFYDGHRHPFSLHRVKGWHVPSHGRGAGAIVLLAQDDPPHSKTERVEGAALLFGRVTYEMMEAAWRQPATGTWPDWMDEWEIPFAETIDRAKKYVVSSTLSAVDWNAELVRGDLGQAVQRLKQGPGEGLFVGGVTLPLALADLGLIDEYEFLVQPVLAGHGPTLLAGLRERIQLELVDRHELRSGAVALRYRPARVTALT